LKHKNKKDLRVKCFKCEKIGRLEIQSHSYYRINHDETKNGKKIRVRCYLGNLDSALKKIERVSKIRNDLIDSNLTAQLFSQLKENENKSETLLIHSVLNLNHLLGDGWYDEKHDLVKQDNCPHCKQKIAVSFRRIGKNPHYSYGKYNVENFRIEQGQKGHTSRFSRRGKLRNEWERGIEKGATHNTDSFFDDVK